MNVLKTLLAEIGYRPLNFVLSLFAVVFAVMLFVTGPMLVDGYKRATGVKLEALEHEVAESADRLGQWEVASATRLRQLEVEANARITQSEAEAAAKLAQMEDETRKLMRDMGFNLTILHREADTIAFLAGGVPTVDMRQESVERLAADPSLTMVTHLVGTLRGEITFDGRQIRLVGYLPETPQAHKTPIGMKKKPMGYDVAPGTVNLGHALGTDRKVGETIEIAGRPFRIAEIQPEKGSHEDVTIAMHLKDAQGLLDKPGLINQIMALECRCAEAALPIIRRQVQTILPDTHVIRDMSKAEARRKQRALVKKERDAIIAGHKRVFQERARALEKSRQERARTLAKTRDERMRMLDNTGNHREQIQELMKTLSSVITPLVLLASAVWVGLLALANVRQRRTEIGILRALGKGSGTIAALLLGKAVLVGLLGALAGGVLGTLAAKWIGVLALQGTAEQFAAQYGILLAALLGFPLLSAVASFLPTLSAVTQDPAVVLRDQ